MMLVRYHRFRQLWYRCKEPIIALSVVFLVLCGLVWRWHWTKKDLYMMVLQTQLAYMKRRYSQDVCRTVDVNDDLLPTIYVITPTYHRSVQKAELTRLCQSLLLVPNLHWVIVEDSLRKTDLVVNFLSKGCGVVYTHLTALTPSNHKLKDGDPQWMRARGVLQRNEALRWLRQRGEDETGNTDGVIYFADDDNTYSSQLFEEMRYTKTVSVWPVGLVGGIMVERPKVGDDPNGGKMVIGWEVEWSPHRPFAIDMAGFAVNYNLFLSKPKANFAYRVKIGYQESTFLSALVTVKELEPKADFCTKVYVWHTKTAKPFLEQEEKRRKLMLPPTDSEIEV